MLHAVGFVLVFGQAFVCVCVFCVFCVFHRRVFFRGPLLWDFTARLIVWIQASPVVLPQSSHFAERRGVPILEAGCQTLKAIEALCLRSHQRFCWALLCREAAEGRWQGLEAGAKDERGPSLMLEP